MADVDLKDLAKYGQALAGAAALFVKQSGVRISIDQAIEKFAAAMTPTLPKKSDGSPWTLDEFKSAASKVKAAAQANIDKFN